MQWLVEIIETLFLYILYPRAEDRHRKLELRRIHREFNYLKLAYTDQGGRRIYANLGYKLLELARIAKSLHGIIGITARREELLDEPELLEYLLLSQMEGGDRERARSFDYQRLKPRLQSVSASSNVWKNIEGEWQEFSRVFHNYASGKIDEELFQLEIIYSLTKHDFPLILGHFGASETELYGEGDVQLKDQDSEKLNEALLDLYFVLASLQISAVTRNLLVALLEYYQNEQEDEQAGERVRDLVDRLEILSESELSPNTLSGLLKLINQDPGFEAESMRLKRRYRDEVWLMLKKRYHHTRDRIQAELNDERKSLNVRRVFGDKKIGTLKTYNRETEEHFFRVGLSGFLYRLPLEVLLTYYGEYYFKGFEGSQKRLYNDGYFEDPRFAEAFGNSLEKQGGIKLSLIHI